MWGREGGLANRSVTKFQPGFISSSSILASLVTLRKIGKFVEAIALSAKEILSSLISYDSSDLLQPELPPVRFWE